jgi:hypothetical protein
LVYSATELSKRLGVSQPSVGISVKRGEKIAEAEKLRLEREKKVIVLWACLKFPDNTDFG